MARLYVFNFVYFLSMCFERYYVLTVIDLWVLVINNFDKFNIARK